VIQAVIDESGVKGTDPVFVLAGLISTAEKLADLSTAWSRQLQAEPTIKYLKMYEATRACGEFAGWSEHRIETKLRGLVETVKYHAHRAIHVTIDLEAHERLHKDRPSRDPYFTGFYAILSGVCYEFLDNFSDEKQIEIILDENRIFGPRVALWYPAIKDLLATRGDLDQQALADVLPPQPSFKDDQAFVPLQAADMLAWLFRTAFSGQRTRFEWIATELMPSVPMSEYASVFTEERIKHQIALSYDLELPPLDYLESWRGVLGIKPSRRKTRKRTIQPGQ
jgi:Protein of unknown function (DUF3800)